MRRTLPTLLAFFLLLAAAALPACRSTECGPGTREEGGACLPLAPINCTGDHVAFIDGRCQVSPSVCGAGTAWNADQGRCVGSGAPLDAGPIAEDASPDDDAPDATASEDAAPDAPALPACGATSASGTVCVSGRVINWATNAPVSAEAPLGVLLDDLNLRITAPAKAPFAASGLGEGGSFVLADVSTSSADGPLQQMILIAGAPPEAAGAPWMRTLSGVRGVATAGQSYPDQVAFAVPLPLVQTWDAALGRADDTSLAAVGFLLLRVLELGDDGVLRPVAGATVANINPEQDALVGERRYLSDDLSGFREEASTGATGAVLLIGAPTGQYTATAAGFNFQPTLGGASPGLAIATAIIGVAP